MSIAEISSQIDELQKTIVTIEVETAELTGHLRLLYDYLNEFHIFELKLSQ